MADLVITPKKIRPLIGGNLTPSMVANSAMNVGDIVYPSANNVVSLCDADTATTVDGLVGMVVAGNRGDINGAIISGETVTVLWVGRVAVDDGSLDLTKSYFASNTTGKLADAAGTTSRRLAYPESTGVLFFNGA